MIQILSLIFPEATPWLIPLAEVVAWFQGFVSGIDWTVVITAIISLVGGIITALVAVKKDWFKLQHQLDLSASDALINQNTTHISELYKSLNQLDAELDACQRDKAALTAQAAVAAKDAENFKRTATTTFRKLKSLLSNKEVTPDHIKACLRVLEMWQAWNDGGTMAAIYDRLEDL